MHSKTSLCATQFVHNLYKIPLFLSTHQRYATTTSKFGAISDLNQPRSGTKGNETSVERQLLGLERDDQIDINHPRTEPDFPEIRVKGPRSNDPKYQSKTKHSRKKLVYNRAGIEKPHAEWGWSPSHDKTAEQWNWKDKNRPNKDIPPSEKEAWPNALTLLNDDYARGKYYNPNDLTTFESYSESARSATFKAALNVGVHWGKEKSLWNQSMGPYLKGVVNDRHIFDLSLTISNLRKVIRLLQSLVMDECNILFVCNDVDVEMRTLARIMCTRCNMPLLDDKWMPGSLTNWNHMAEHYRGPGREMMDGKRPDPKQWRKTKLHRLIREAPDFIFLFNRKHSDILVHEANRMSVPVAALCDSDDSTRDLQYVIPCNTQSIQSVHFILDMITRGVLEAQSKMDSVWWSKQKDLEVDRDALHAAEVEWQYKYDPYQQQRHSTFMMAGGAPDDTEELDIATNYIKDDQDVLESNQVAALDRKLVIGKYGNVQSGSFHKLFQGKDMKSDGDFSVGDAAEQSRQNKLKTVLDNRSTEYERRYNEKQNVEDMNEEYVKKFELPKTFGSTSDFAMSMLQDYTTNQVKMRQKTTSFSTSKFPKK